MKYLITIVLACVLGASCFGQSKGVSIKGELKNFPKEFKMSKFSPEGLLLKEGVKITLDEQNKFNVTLDLDKAAYYRLGRNWLYLTPGDQLELSCDMNDPNVGVFSGDGAEACDYLKTKPFPKGGSYITEDNFLKGKPGKEEVRKHIANKVKAKQDELAALENVSQKFREIENARIRFDAANSLLSYGTYAGFAAKMPNDEIMKFSKEATDFFKSDIDQYCANGGDADYLSIDTYLSVMERCIQIMGKENVDQEIIDFGIAYPLVMQLGFNGPVSSVLIAKDKAMNEIKTKEFLNAINKSFEKYDLIMPGQMADDLNMKNQKGEAVKLSDYRGKIVVIDVWATWCGPCKKESPYFEKLAEKYKGNTNLHFVSISIDSNTKSWEKYLAKHPKVSEQLICNRTEFEQYVLQGVPRFMLIGKKGEIIDVFAPVPSNPKLEELIQNQLN